LFTIKKKTISTFVSHPAPILVTIPPRPHPQSTTILAPLPESECSHLPSLVNRTLSSHNRLPEPPLSQLGYPGYLHSEPHDACESPGLPCTSGGGGQ
jgi:hypothetical protein